MAGTRRTGRSILFLVASDYDALVRKGVAAGIAERDEGGFFDRVVSAHPFAHHDRTIEVNERHVVVEYAGPWTRRRRGRAGAVGQRLAHLVRAFSRLRRLMRREGVTAVRATDPYWMGFLAWAITRPSPRIPYCVSLHADYDQRYRLDGALGAPTVFGSRRWAKALERFVLKRTPLVMPIRESLVPYAVRNGASSEAIHVIPHGLDFAPFDEPPSGDIRERFGIPDERKIVSFVGRLSRENYVDDILALARELSSGRDDFVVLMVGGGPEMDRLSHAIGRDRALSRCARLLGFQPASVVRDVRRASTVSLCLMGGFSLIEACAAGSAVIAYDVEWHGELIADGDNGFLIPEGDGGALARCATKLLDDGALAARIGGEARRHVQERHDLSLASKCRRQAYRSLLDDRRADA